MPFQDTMVTGILRRPLKPLIWLYLRHITLVPIQYSGNFSVRVHFPWSDTGDIIGLRKQRMNKVLVCSIFIQSTRDYMQGYRSHQLINHSI